MLVVTAVLADAATGFAHGITAVNPHATGTYTWGGLSFLQSTVTCRAVSGTVQTSGGGLTLWAWVTWLAVSVLVGRLWRAPSTWRARAHTVHG
jgi:hypothetical protein